MHFIGLYGKGSFGQFDPGDGPRHPGKHGPITTTVHESVPVTVLAEVLLRFKVELGDCLSGAVKGRDIELVVRQGLGGFRAGEHGLEGPSRRRGPPPELRDSSGATRSV